MKTQINKLLSKSNVRKCFHTFHFLPAQLTEEEAAKGTEFPTEMFFKLFSNPFMVDEYSYFFFMQTDIVPVGNYWADVIYQETYSGSYFWMKGSVTR